MNKEHIQHTIEKLAYTEACSSKKNQMNSHIENGQEFNLAYGQEVIKHLLPEGEDYIRDLYTRRNQHTKPFFWQIVKPQYAKHLEEKGNKSIKPWERTPDPAVKLSELVAVLLVSNLSKGCSLNSIAETVARAGIQQMGVKPEESKAWREKATSFFTPMILHISEKTDVFTVEQVEKREYRLFLSDKWRDKIESIQGKFGLNVAKHKPMVVPPKPHTSLVDNEGGYLYTPSPLLKYPVKDKGRIHPSILNFNAETQPDWFEAINKAQATPYCVNERLLNVIQDFYSRGIVFKDFPTEPDCAGAVASAQKEIDTRNANRQRYAEKKGKEYTPLLKSTCDKVFKLHQANATEQARSTNGLLSQALSYLKTGELYFPLFVDYRGRRYPYANTSLSFQGCELAKALLQFANKKPLGHDGEVVMYETLGNTLKMDKLVCGLKEDLARDWFLTHIEDFMAGDYSVFFEKQEEFDEPINALAICIELTEHFKDPDYESGYIAHRDARCSGASIIGTIMRDKNVMEMTSVIDWADDEGNLGDAYRYSAEKALAICEEMADKGDNLCLALLDFSHILFTRKSFKLQVMVKSSYGGTEYGMRQYNWKLLDWEEEGLTYEHKAKFDDIMLQALDEALPSCSKYLEVAREAAEKMVVRDEMITFTNPLTNFPVVQRDFKSDKRIIDILNNFQRIRITLISPTDKIDKMGMINSFAPNLTHSMDAALLSLVEWQLSRCDLSLIHDSVGSHPADTKFVIRAYSEAMKLLSEVNVFQVVFDEMNVGAVLKRSDTYEGPWVHSTHCLA